MGVLVTHGDGVDYDQIASDFAGESREVLRSRHDGDPRCRLGSARGGREQKHGERL